MRRTLACTLFLLGAACGDAAADLASGDDRLVAEATQALGWRGRASAAERAQCVRNAQHDSPGVRAATVWALGRLLPLPPEAREALIALLADTNALVRASAAWALAAHAATQPELRDVIARLRDDREPWVQYVAQQALDAAH